MRNKARQNYRKDNRNFQDAPEGFYSQKSKSNEDASQDLFTVNKGFANYGKKFYLESDDAWSNYDDDKKNSEQEIFEEGSTSDLDKSGNNAEDDNKNTNQKGYVDDTDFGQTFIEQNPNRNDNGADNEKNL